MGDLSRNFHFDAPSFLIGGHRIAMAYQKALEGEVVCPGKLDSLPNSHRPSYLRVSHPTKQPASLVNITPRISTYLTTNATSGGSYGNNGIMFYVKAKALINVRHFEVYSEDENESQVQVYTLPGKYEGYEVSELGWENVYNETVNMLGPKVSTKLGPINDGGINILPGEYQSFLIWSSNNVVKYDPGKVVDDLFVSDDYLEIYEGVGVVSLFSGDCADLYAPRRFKGLIG